MGQAMKAFGGSFLECDRGSFGGWRVYLSESDGKYTPHDTDCVKIFGLTSKKSAMKRL